MMFNITVLYYFLGSSYNGGHRFIFKIKHYLHILSSVSFLSPFPFIFKTILCVLYFWKKFVLFSSDYKFYNITFVIISDINFITLLWICADNFSQIHITLFPSQSVASCLIHVAS